MCWPGRVGVKSPSPVKYFDWPMRSSKLNGLSKTKASLWNMLSTAGRLVVVTSRAVSEPLPLKWRYFVLSGIANRLFGPHSKVCLRPSAASIVVLPRPERT